MVDGELWTGGPDLIPNRPLAGSLLARDAFFCLGYAIMPAAAKSINLNQLNSDRSAALWGLRGERYAKEIDKEKLFAI